MIPVGSFFFLEDPFSSESQIVLVLFCQPELRASPVILIHSSPCASTALLVNISKKTALSNILRSTRMFGAS